MCCCCMVRPAGGGRGGAVLAVFKAKEKEGEQAEELEERGRREQWKCLYSFRLRQLTLNVVFRS